MTDTVEARYPFTLWAYRGNEVGAGHGGGSYYYARGGGMCDTVGWFPSVVAAREAGRIWEAHGCQTHIEFCRDFR